MVNNKNIEEVLNQYNSRINSVVKKFFRAENNSYADDVKQEVYIKVWKNFSKCRNINSPWGWINTITVNACKDQLKKNKKNAVVCNDDEIDIISNVPDQRAEAGKSVEQIERQKMIMNSIEKLSKKHKEVIIYYDIHDFSYEEIALKINKPVGTVKSRLFTARKALYEDLKELLA